MTTAERVHRAATRGGLYVVATADDPGALRLYRSGTARDLVGLVVVRADRATHGEISGRVFPFWPNGSRPYPRELDQLLEQIRNHR